MRIRKQDHEDGRLFPNQGIFNLCSMDVKFPSGKKKEKKKE